MKNYDLAQKLYAAGFGVFFLVVIPVAIGVWLDTGMMGVVVVPAALGIAWHLRQLARKLDPYVNPAD